jgi:hypothetical protein
MPEDTAPGSGHSIFGKIDLPMLSNSLKDVYKAGSMPLALVFLAAIIIVALVIQGVLQTLPAIMYLVGGLVAFGGILFLFMNWFAYRQWREELKAHMENRRMEMDLYLKVSTSRGEIQDRFILGIMAHVNELLKREGGTPEGRAKEVSDLIKSAGTLVKEFETLRNDMTLPFLSALPGRSPLSLEKPAAQSTL